MTTCDMHEFLYSELDNWVARAVRAEADARRLYQYVISGGDKADVVRLHLEAVAQSGRRVA